MKYLFDPGAIVAVADRDELTGASVTVIYGLTAQEQKVSESVAALLQRLSLASAFAKLTRPDGSSVLINGKAVSVVRQPVPGQDPAGVNAVIFAGGVTQSVREPLDTVRQAINQAGGRL
jgi:hypothetical protein